MFTVNEAKCDYLTVTTFNPVVMFVIDQWHRGIGVAREGKKRMQYAGTVTSDRYGQSFYGIGTQRGMTHSLLQVSGELADSALTAVREFIFKGQCRVTRIDLQVTVPYPRETWRQVELFEALKYSDMRSSVSYIESRSGPANSTLATVYIGSRSSDRLVRIYEKLGLGESVFLRFEAEYKGKRAMAVTQALLAGNSERSVLQSELMRIPDTYNLRDLYMPILDGDKAEIRVMPETGNTEKWLRETVIPALDRFLQSHDTESMAMAELFQKVLDDATIKHHGPGRSVDNEGAGV